MWEVGGKSSFLYTTGWFIEAQAEDISFTSLLDVATGIFHYVNMRYVMINRNWFTVGRGENMRSPQGDPKITMS